MRDHLNQEEGKKKKKTPQAHSHAKVSVVSLALPIKYKLTSFIYDICLLNDVFICDI